MYNLVTSWVYLLLPSLFHLLLNILVYVYCLPSQAKKRLLKIRSKQKEEKLRSSNVKTYSQVKESPISQMSTIFAFGLHWDITSCNASAWMLCYKEQCHNSYNKKLKSNYAASSIRHAMERQRLVTVYDLSSIFVLCNNTRRGEIQLHLLAFIFRRHLFVSVRYVKQMI